MAKKKSSKKPESKLVQIVDLDSFPPVNTLEVSVNGVPTELKIGDKLVYPENSAQVKTIVAITIFEDGAINYRLKWYDGDFKTEVVSLTELKLLNDCKLFKPPVGYSSSSK